VLVPQAPRKVVVVNGSIDLLIALGDLLEGKSHDVVFVDSTGLAYGQIKRILPDLIILCGSGDDLDALRVLSMVKADDETRDIPTISCFVAEERADDDDDMVDFATRLAARAKSSVRMH
jgi:CheY-like chemotaxis protein